VYRDFINTELFEKCWDELGFGDDELRLLENEILENPKAGAVIRGTGGMRKIRFSFKNHGKRGGVRVIYIDIEEKSCTFFILAYPKSQKENITAAEKKMLQSLSSELRKVNE
jgi:hypothetical protein